MAVSERLAPFGYSLQNISLLTDGFVANWVVFWSSAVPRGQEHQDDMPVRLRNARLYTSQLTQANSVPKTHSVQGKVNNWVFLNKRVLNKLEIALKDETVTNLVNGDRNTVVAFFDMLFNALERFCEARDVEIPADDRKDLKERSRDERLATVLAKSDLATNPKTAVLEPRKTQLRKTAVQQREYAERLSANEYPTSARLRYEPVECEKCKLYEKKIRCLEEEVAFLRRKLADKE